MNRCITLGCAAILAAPPAARAQSLEARVRTVGDGTASVSYAARSGTCGDGRSMIRFGDMVIASNMFFGRGSLEPGSVCNVGPAHAELTIAHGTITDVRPFVGGPVSGRDLGTVDAIDAAHTFLHFAATADGRAAGGALNAAAIADADVASDILAVGRNASAARDTRTRALFWYQAIAGDSGVSELASIARDAKESDELRGTAMFAIGESRSSRARETLIGLHDAVHGTSAEEKLMAAMGQQRDDRGAWLMQRALSADEPEHVRKQALFWASQSSMPTSALVASWDKLGTEDLQRHLLFLLGQRGDSVAVNKLIDVARHDPDHDLQRQAIFWLAQVHDRRAEQTIGDILKP